MVVLNAALLACILSLACLLALGLHGIPWLVPHAAFLLALAVALLILINWCGACCGGRMTSVHTLTSPAGVVNSG